MSLVTQHAEGWFRATTALITGDVRIGSGSSLWFNVIVRGDVAPITIGQRVNVQDGSIIHCDTGVPLTIEDDVSIGHAAVVHCAHVGRGSLIGIGARVLGRVRIGAQCLVAAGALVTPGTQIPDRQLVVGIPARIVRPLNDQELEYLGHVTRTYQELAGRYARGEVMER